ncbi:MAG TPA: hypothetical protein VM600_08820, partial [Actinomycetota bacterium]|nr:hypothetical protein [Actinomycetota bacterium]
IVPAQPDKHALGRSSVVEVGAGLSPAEAENQIRPFRAEVLAPGADPVDTSVLRQALSTIAFTDLIRTAGSAKWNGTTCVVGEPIAEGKQHLARVELLERDDDEETAADQGFDHPVVGLDAHQAGPPRASSSMISQQVLYKGNGPGLGLFSVATATLAPVTFFEGEPNEFTIEVSGLAALVARADGTSGGASVTYRAPVVSVIQEGESRQVVPSAPIVVRLPSTGDAVAAVKVSTMEPLPAPHGLGTTTQTADGTRAAAQAHIVEVTLLDAAAQGLRGATIALGHLEAAALVPRDGIVCPIPVTKVADPDAVRSGQEFTTTITVENPFACPINNLELVDEITVVNGARFRILSADPSASFTAGSELTSGTVTWQLGTLAPGAERSVTVRLLAQGSAGRIEDIATATGTLSNCPVSPDEDGADVTSLARATVGVVGVGRLTVPESQVLGASFERGALAETGVADSAPLGLGLLVGAAAVAILARKRALR